MFGMTNHDAEAQRICKMFESPRLKAYDDGTGTLTIGWGHTKTVKPGQRIDMKQAERLFQGDWAVAKAAVLEPLKVSLPPEKIAALSMFVFNVGGAAFARSTMLWLINERRFSEAEEQFDRWVNAGGRKLRGLELRRCVERLIWQGHARIIDPPFVKALRGLIE